MEQQTRINPLKQYFRQYKMYLRLPSGTSYYAPGAIAFTDTGEVGIMPMTGKDEMILKNPDALLNGESLIEVIKSCVPAIKDPRTLLTNDIDAIITAIRHVTYNGKLETELECPSCGHDNSFKLDLQYALDNMSYLEPEYTVNLESGVTVYVKPYGFPELLKGLHAQFEQSKLQRMIQNENLTDEQRLKMFAGAFKEISTITFFLMASSVVKVVDERNDVNVTDKSFIQEFLLNIDKTEAEEITKLIEEINKIGIEHTFQAKCQKCEHEWTTQIDFNPVNFS